MDAKLRLNDKFDRCW